VNDQRILDLPSTPPGPIGTAGVGRLVCPHCATETPVEIPTHACLFFFDCPACHVLVQPASGDCCVFCSFGDRPCPAKGCC
jgi:hypothetical protein